MRVMLDTNVLISAMLFPNSRINRMLEDIVERHTLVIASFVIEELRAVVERKFPGKSAALERMLAQMSFELAFTPRQMEPGLFEIRDRKDYPVLYTAMTNGVDVLITGDKDFADVEVDFPEILTPAGYAEKYMAGRAELYEKLQVGMDDVAAGRVRPLSEGFDRDSKE